MAVSDLTGTKWEFFQVSTSGFGKTAQTVLTPVEVTPDSNSGYNINYYSSQSGGSEGDVNNWLGLVTRLMPQESTDIMSYGSLTNVSVGDVIEIISGSDVTDPDLIAWLEANATQIIEPTQSDYLEIYSNDERATHYKIYANGVLIATIARVNVVQEGSELTVLSAPATQNGSEVTLG